MPTIRQLKEWVDHQIAQGKAGDHTNHVVCIEDEQAKRIRNEPDDEGKQKTRIAWETNDPECYSSFHIQRERYFKFAGGNPVLATEAVIMALKIQEDEDIQRFIEAIQTVKNTNPLVPKANLKGE
jgi:hypothetical protein